MNAAALLLLTPLLYHPAAVLLLHSSILWRFCLLSTQPDEKRERFFAVKIEIHRYVFINMSKLDGTRLGLPGLDDYGFNCIHTNFNDIF